MNRQTKIDTLLQTTTTLSPAPLLQFAFLLVIVFVIATPFLSGIGSPHSSLGPAQHSPVLEKEENNNPKFIQILEISSSGAIRLDGRVFEAIELETQLRANRALQPDIGVIVRAHENGKTGDLFRVMNMLKTARIPRVALLPFDSKVPLPSPTSLP